MDSYPVGTDWSPIGTSYEQTLSWDYTAMQPMKETISRYNDLLQRAADFYASLDGSMESLSPRNTDNSIRLSPDSTSSMSSSSMIVKRSTKEKVERRREQNRSSQRAYRDRKEKHQKELEDQIAEWERKHEVLSQSYLEQTQEVTRLKSQVKQLRRDILAMSPSFANQPSFPSTTPYEFDLVPFYNIGDDDELLSVIPMAMNSPKRKL